MPIVAIYRPKAYTSLCTIHLRSLVKWPYAARSTTMILAYLFCDCEHRVNMVYTISFVIMHVSSSCVKDTDTGICKVNATVHRVNTVVYEGRTVVYTVYAG